MTELTRAFVEQLAAAVGATHVSTDPHVLRGRSVDHTGRYHGNAGALVRPASAAEAADVVRLCGTARVPLTVQGGRTSLVAGTVPEYGDVLLSTERLTTIGPVDRADRRVRVGAGVTAAALQRVAIEAGLLFGVDLASRDSATVGGMASTNAGGLRTVRYGNMAEQILGIEVVLPDGTLLHRHSRVRRDNTGYDMSALFVGAEGTLGVITALDVRLHPTPVHRAAAVCGFDDLAVLVDAARHLRDLDAIAALELIDASACAVAAAHLGVPAPVPGRWVLLVELAGEVDQTEGLADALGHLGVAERAAVGIDPSARQRLWQVREAHNEILGVYGPPLKFDVALPLSEVARFAAEVEPLLTRHCPAAIPVLFGHIAEGNLHLNLLRAAVAGAAERALQEELMALIAGCGGNVSSEHGVGSRKRDFVGLSRTAADIAAMRTVKDAFDPHRLVNRAVLFG
ncbi:FAD-binding oxidoreductase [Aldersonia sp. NBC_00410]|uniref:FAD-binding oxidoreductase n=1 Tax=Aldersonia sp. NBC_00410 TaxID=2975954 RepID=UPI002255A650|nr:FAD-binding oxidoreductase [Aldersonia sp. NBC_00410]MCX5044890.1 FAD-binding oxidoreductase [Aldersonia sp. NBC_00410]